MKTKTKMTQSKLAEIVGVSRQLVAFHVKTGKAPKLDDIDGWLEHLAAVGKDGSLPPELRKKIAEQRLRKLKAEATMAEHELKLREKQLVEWEFVDKFLAFLLGQKFWGELEKWSQELPPLLQGLPATEICKVIDARFRRLCEDFKSVVERWQEERAPVQTSALSKKNKPAKAASDMKK